MTSQSSFDKMPTVLNADHESEANLDFVLHEIGDFRGRQIWKFLWIGVPIILSASFAITFVVTATNLDYRYVTNNAICLCYDFLVSIYNM